MISPLYERSGPVYSINEWQQIESAFGVIVLLACSIDVPDVVHFTLPPEKLNVIWHHLCYYETPFEEYGNISHPQRAEQDAAVPCLFNADKVFDGCVRPLDDDPLQRSYSSSSEG